ncbi:MAG: 50S ribosomal protein L4 [Patescibacteria group bacterium]|jgi:large subunit ribosomal protein L4|nr:50S ribosomal protein L4 [Patescibacteria group bacterium]
MLKASIYNQKAEVVGDINLPENIFGVKVKESLVHQAVVAQMSNERQILAHTKQRADVRGGGKKPWKQKGTGRARAGSSRSPIWIGGGVAFGPLKNRNFSKDLNLKMKRAALFMALSDKLAEKNVAILDKIVSENFKTKEFDKVVASFEKGILKNESKVKKEEADPKDGKKKVLKVKRSVLLINANNEEKDKYSANNLAGIKLINLDNINIVDLLRYKKLIITVDAIKKIEQRYK